HGQVAMATPRMPSNFSLSAYPNPLSLSAAQAGTKVTFSVASGANVRVTIVDLAGRTVRTLIDNHVDAGSQVIEWNAQNDEGKVLPSGTYFVTMRASVEGLSDMTATQKIVLTR